MRAQVGPSPRGRAVWVLVRARSRRQGRPHRGAGTLAPLAAAGDAPPLGPGALSAQGCVTGWLWPHPPIQGGDPGTQAPVPEAWPAPVVPVKVHGWAGLRRGRQQSSGSSPGAPARCTQASKGSCLAVDRLPCKQLSDPLSVCVCVCVCERVHVHIHAHVCIHVHVPVCAFVHVHPHMFMCACVLMCAHSCAAMSTHVRVCVCIPVCACIRMCVHLTLGGVYLHFTETVSFVESVSLTVFLSRTRSCLRDSARPCRPVSVSGGASPELRMEAARAATPMPAVCPERGHRGHDHGISFISPVCVFSPPGQVRVCAPSPATSADTAASPRVGAGT